MPSPQIARTVQNGPETAGGPPLTVVVVGGVDPGGGAGLLRDVATAAAWGADSVALGTAWTEQGAGVHRVEPRDPAAVLDTLRRAVANVRPAAIKIGMAVGPATVEALVTGLEGYDGPVVVDPVLATSGGGALWAGSTRELLPLLRRATLVTPNAPEAAALTGRAVVTEAGAEGAARTLVEVEGLSAALVKGGHWGDGPVVDVLFTPAGPRRFARRRFDGPSPRGTGCALATAIAVELGRGRSLPSAVEAAATWLSGAIAAARRVRGERHLAF